jgi:hypothetical protein
MLTGPPLDSYVGQRATLVTMHDKDRVLGPLLASALDLRLDTIRDVNTDSLGTFTRDVPRAGSQLEAARRKARMAIDASGASCGLGSEGSFFPGPLGLGSWNLEFVLLLDAERGVEIVGRARGPGLQVHGIATSPEELTTLAQQAQFPSHGLVLRPDGPDSDHMVKGVHDWDTLASAFADLRNQSVAGQVFVESDLRAHRHPSRKAMIARAGQDLVERLRTPCAACGQAGFGWTEAQRGLPCGACGTPTQDAYADILACVRCPHRETRPRDGPKRADPARCPACNP